MAAQFRRFYELQLTNPDGKVVTTNKLRVVFEITKDLFGWPNLAKIAVYNLSLSRAVEISESFTNVVLKVGYGGELISIFKGGIKNIINRREGVDTVTEIFAGDGEKPLRNATFFKTFAAGIPVKQIVKDIATTFGIPMAKLDGLDSNRAGTTGFSFSGASKDLLDKLSDDFNFYWSVQDGQFVTQSRDGIDKVNSVIQVNRLTGMVRSPSITEIGADVTVLMNPLLQPYRAFEIKTPFTEVNVGNLFFRENIPTLGTGLFRVNKVTHKGDFRGNDWTSAVVGLRQL